MIDKGPLLTIAMALFGQDSYLGARTIHPEAYIIPITDEDASDKWKNWICVGLAPFLRLLGDAGTDGGNSQGIYPDYCLKRHITNETDLQDEVAFFLQSLMPNQTSLERLTNAYNAASFLANQAWLMHSNAALDPWLTVSFDMGADTEKPLISTAGIFVVSILLALYIIALLSIAVYSSWTPRWTQQLDSFAMMRIGAAMGLAFMVARDVDKISVLDKTPGWVGDVTEGEAPIGEIGIGAQTTLRGRRAYVSYG